MPLAKQFAFLQILNSLQFKLEYLQFPVIYIFREKPSCCNNPSQPHGTINTRFDTPLKISKFSSFFEKSVMRAWKKSLVIAREERLGKNLARPSGEERKTFKFRRFSSGRHWEQVRMTRESLIGRRKCNGKVSRMSLEPWFRLRACISSVRSDRRSKVFS
jgi:hypothetical protein